MPFARIRDLLQSLAFRLTFWHAGLLLLALGLCYTASYLLVSSLTMARIDTYLNEESDECLRLFNLEHRTAVETEATREAQEVGLHDLYYVMFDSSGEPVFHTDAAAWLNLQVPTAMVLQAAKASHTTLLSMDRGGKSPEVRVIIAPLSPTYTLLIAISTSDDFTLARGWMFRVFLVMAGVWLLTVAVGFLLANRGVRGIHSIRDAAVALADGRTATRVRTTARGDEIDRLANAFNTMADRIEGLLENLRQTNDRLAHEIRTPITAMRVKCELALSDTRSQQYPPAVLEDAIERCDYVLKLVNTTLEISETNAGMSHTARHPIHLDQLLTSACDIFAPVAEDSGIVLTFAKKCDAVVAGDKAKLQRLFSNLLENALKYAGRGGRATINTEIHGADAYVAIHDTGPGVAPQEREAIFQRFFRGSASEGHAGNGLGLSLARTIARAHGGDIWVNRQTGQGAEFIVRLPIAPAN